MRITIVHRLIVPAIVAAFAAQFAYAQLPIVEPLQELGPNAADFGDDPEELPSPPLFGSALTVVGGLALAGMPGAFDDTGRVGVFVRHTNGEWRRQWTLLASDAAAGARFGSHLAIFFDRVLVASHTAVYVFQLQGGQWRETGKLAFGRAVRIRDLDWHQNLVLVGTADAAGNAAYAFFLKPDGTFKRVARIAAHDARPADQFGERVAVYNSTVAITAPGYNARQGAAYVFACNEVSCVQKQKLLANDGEPGDDFGRAVDIHGNRLVVGAPGTDHVSSETAPFRAGGAGYVFVRSNSTWVEQQKLRPSRQELEAYSLLGFEVLISRDRVLLGAPFQVDPWEPGFVFEYRQSGGSLIAHRVLTNFREGHGEVMALSGDTLFVGLPGAAPFDGSAVVYNLGAP